MLYFPLCLSDLFKSITFDNGKEFAKWKDINLSCLSTDCVQQVASYRNNIPRKSLGYKTPLFMKYITNEDEIMTVVYNFIVDSSLIDDEPKAFINFKDSVGSGTNFSRVLISLPYVLRQIALKNVSKNVGMTPNVNGFYKKIVTYGLSSYGVIF